MASTGASHTSSARQAASSQHEVDALHASRPPSGLGLRTSTAMSNYVNASSLGSDFDWYRAVSTDHDDQDNAEAPMTRQPATYASQKQTSVPPKAGRNNSALSTQSFVSAAETVQSDVPGSRHLLAWLSEERHRTCGRSSRVSPLATVLEPAPSIKTATPSRDQSDLSYGQQSRFSVSPQKKSPSSHSFARSRRNSQSRTRKIMNSAATPKLKTSAPAVKSLQGLKKLMARGQQPKAEAPSDKQAAIPCQTCQRSSRSDAVAMGQRAPLSRDEENELRLKMDQYVLARQRLSSSYLRGDAPPRIQSLKNLAQIEQQDRERRQVQTFDCLEALQGFPSSENASQDTEHARPDDIEEHFPTHRSSKRDTVVVRGSWIEIGKASNEVATAENGRRAQGKWWSRMRQSTSGSIKGNATQTATTSSTTGSGFTDFTRKSRERSSSLELDKLMNTTSDSISRRKATKSHRSAISALAQFPATMRRKRHPSVDLDEVVDPWYPPSEADQSRQNATRESITRIPNAMHAFPQSSSGLESEQKYRCAKQYEAQSLEATRQRMSYREGSTGVSLARYDIARRPSGELNRLLCSSQKVARREDVEIAHAGHSPLRRNNSLPLLSRPLQARDSQLTSTPSSTYEAHDESKERNAQLIDCGLMQRHPEKRRTSRHEQLKVAPSAKEDSTERTIGSSILFADQYLATRESVENMKLTPQHLNKPLPPVHCQDLLTPHRATSILSRLVTDYHSDTTISTMAPSLSRENLTIASSMRVHHHLGNKSSLEPIADACEQQNQPLTTDTRPRDANTTLETILSYQTSVDSWSSSSVSELIISDDDDEVTIDARGVGEETTRERDSNLQLLIDGVSSPRSALRSKGKALIQGYSDPRDPSRSCVSSEAGSTQSRHQFPSPGTRRALADKDSNRQQMHMLGHSLFDKHLSVLTQESPCPSPRALNSRNTREARQQTLSRKELQEIYLRSLDLTQRELRSHNLHVGQVLVPQARVQVQRSLSRRSSQRRRRTSSKKKSASSRDASKHTQHEATCDTEQRPFSEVTFATTSSFRDSMQSETAVIKHADLARKSSAARLDLQLVADTIARARRQSQASSVFDDKENRAPSSHVRSGVDAGSRATRPRKTSKIGNKKSPHDQRRLRIGDSPHSTTSPGSLMVRSDGDTSFAWSENKRNSINTTCTVPSPCSLLNKFCDLSVSGLSSTSFIDTRKERVVGKRTEASTISADTKRTSELDDDELKESRNKYPDTSYSRLILSTVFEPPETLKQASGFIEESTNAFAPLIAGFPVSPMRTIRAVETRSPSWRAARQRQRQSTVERRLDARRLAELSLRSMPISEKADHSSHQMVEGAPSSAQYHDVGDKTTATASSMPSEAIEGELTSDTPIRAPQTMHDTASRQRSGTFSRDSVPMESTPPEDNNGAPLSRCRSVQQWQGIRLPYRHNGRDLASQDSEWQDIDERRSVRRLSRATSSNHSHFHILFAPNCTLKEADGQDTDDGDHAEHGISAASESTVSSITGMASSRRQTASWTSSSGSLRRGGRIVSGIQIVVQSPSTASNSTGRRRDSEQRTSTISTRFSMQSQASSS